MKWPSIEPEAHASGLAVEINGLKISFGNNCILKDISLSLKKGENLAVLGKSGSGKSVLIKCIVGLLVPDEGSIKVFGKEVSGLPHRQLNEMRKKIGFLFQSAALYDSMTVRENLEFPLRRTKMKKNEIDELVEETLDNVGLLDAIDKMPASLSGGMRKRVGLARTLILKPEIMLYDEPTTGLDPITSQEISILINKVKKKYNTASIIISHDIPCTRTTADRIILIHEGLCVAEGTFSELNQHDDPLIKQFFEY